MPTIEQIIKESDYSILYDGDRMSQHLMKFKDMHSMVTKEEIQRHVRLMKINRGIDTTVDFLGVGFAIITVRYD